MLLLSLLLEGLGELVGVIWSTPWLGLLVVTIGITLAFGEARPKCPSCEAPYEEKHPSGSDWMLCEHCGSDLYEWL